MFCIQYTEQPACIWQVKSSWSWNEAAELLLGDYVRSEGRKAVGRHWMAQRSAARALAAPWRSLSMHFANSQMQPLLLRSRYLARLRKRVRARVSLHMIWRPGWQGAPARWRLHTLASTAHRGGGGDGRGGGKATALKRFLASQSFLLLCEFCAKVHQGGGRDGEPAAHSTVAVHRRWHSRQATRLCGGRQLGAEMARIAIPGPARICNVLCALCEACTAAATTLPLYVDLR